MNRTNISPPAEYVHTDASEEHTKKQKVMLVQLGPNPTPCKFQSVYIHWDYRKACYKVSYANH
jgi:hypothetical protein